MTNHDNAEFSDSRRSGGPEFVLLNPDSPGLRLRLEMVRAFASGRASGLAVTGVLLVVVGITVGANSLWLAVVGVIFFGSGVVCGLENLACYTTGECGYLGNSRRGAARPGEFCYRTRDFETMGARANGIAVRVFEAAEYIAAAPARTWPDPEVPTAAHRLAWEILHCLDQTRSARGTCVRLGAHPRHSEVARSMARALVDVDRKLDQAARSLGGVALLGKEWNRKLRGIESAHQAELELGSLHNIPVDEVESTAESLLERTFYQVTAARDLTCAGSFPWEGALPAQLSEQSNVEGAIR
ncbi:hypothetical protein [Amycolatopsis sp. La24]|uniref:hypothetical protein n=1 Tax=Amycolatopsis sp. La24 TaxID=3028304 RepID=UPI0023B1C4E2|nr:hypothetical protein [Amycolatopsis sp. La24]